MANVEKKASAFWEVRVCKFVRLADQRSRLIPRYSVQFLLFLKRNLKRQNFILQFRLIFSASRRTFFIHLPPVGIARGKQMYHTRRVLELDPLAAEDRSRILLLVAFVPTSTHTIHLISDHGVF